MNKLLVGFMVVLLFIFGCAKFDEELYDGFNSYSLTVKNGSGGGKYLSGEKVTVTAKDSTGYTFSAWTGDIGELDHANAKTAIVTMPNKNINITATYTIPTYTLTVTNGSGSGEYIEGKTVTVTAKDSIGYTFSAWTGDIGELDHVNAKTAIVTMPNNNITITATYTEINTDPQYGMRVITGGTFSMGSNNGYSTEKPVHQVTVGW